MELQRALNDRRRLLVEMNQIGEERLKLIGQELHDGLGQQLIGIAFLVKSLTEIAGGGSAPERDRVRQVDQLPGEATALVRSLSRGLYPVALETGGLSAALAHLADHASSFSGAQCVVRASTGVNAIDKTTSLNRYRIAQEAVSNAPRHGKAQRIETGLSGSKEEYRMVVDDNGTGFRGRRPQSSETLGMRSMQCRADLIGARLEIGNGSEGGASVLVTRLAKREGVSIARK